VARYSSERSIYLTVSNLLFLVWSRLNGVIGWSCEICPFAPRGLC
jgi:hypothetical protein